ncbi:MAG: hypothetical protein ACR2JH_05140, partial [Solirubrobacteraceae bacterium]
MGSSVSVSAGRYLLGIVALLLMCGALGRAAFLLRRRFFGDWTGAQARLAEAVLAVALLVAEMEILGAVGLFRLIPLVIGAVAIGLGTQRAFPGEGQKRPPPPPGNTCVPPKLPPR